MILLWPGHADKYLPYDNYSKNQRIICFCTMLV